jgi:hypothetical protein
MINIAIISELEGFILLLLLVSFLFMGGLFMGFYVYVAIG